MSSTRTNVTQSACMHRPSPRGVRAVVSKYVVHAA